MEDGKQFNHGDTPPEQSTEDGDAKGRPGTGSGGASFLDGDCDENVPKSTGPVAVTEFKDAGPPGSSARPTISEADDEFPDAFGHSGLIELMMESECDEATQAAFARTVENRLSCLAQQRQLALPVLVDEQQLHEQRVASLLSEEALFEKKLRYERHADWALSRALRRIAMMRRTSVGAVLAGIGSG